MIDKELEKKAANYNYITNVITGGFLLFGLAPACIGLFNNNIDLTYRGLNFCVVSFALLFAIKNGLFFSDRVLKKGWQHWQKLNKKRVKRAEVITIALTFTILCALHYIDFFKL